MTTVTSTADVDRWNTYLERRGKVDSSAHSNGASNGELPPEVNGTAGSGCLFLRAEWERVWSVYGLTAMRLAALRDNQIVGILPLVWQRSMVFGSHLVSLPWFDAAGLVAEDDDARAALIREALELADQCGAETVQLRQAEPLKGSAAVRTDKLLLRLKLPPDPDQLWASLSSKVRNQVRKAQKSGLEVERGGRQLLADFFSVYSTNMRDLGSPSHAHRFFTAVLETFPDATIYTVRFEGQVIGAGLTMANGDRLEIPWASSLKDYNRYCVNHLMYWEILADACRAGFRWFHFGRSSRDSGTYHFKKQWGAEPLPLHWHYLSSNLKRAIAAADPPQAKYGWGTRLWQRLPLPVAQRLGPRIIANVP